MERPRIAINAAVLAAAIRIETCLKTYVGTGIASDDRFGSIAKILCNAAGLLGFVRSGVHNIEVVNINVQSFEPIGRTPGSPPSTDDLAALRSLVNDRAKFLLRRHLLSSHEHIAMSSAFHHHSHYSNTVFVILGCGVISLRAWSNEVMLLS